MSHKTMDVTGLLSVNGTPVTQTQCADMKIKRMAILKIYQKATNQPVSRLLHSNGLKPHTLLPSSWSNGPTSLLANREECQSSIPLSMS